MAKETRQLPPLNIDRKSLRALIRTLERTGVTEFEYEDEKVRLRIGRGGAPSLAGAAVSLQQLAPSPGPPQTSVDETESAFVTSPFVGTFYRSPSPDSAPFVEVGSVVRQGQALCIVEAMKLMNEIEADVAGTIVEILVSSGKAVEFGQKLFRVRKSLGLLRGLRLKGNTRSRQEEINVTDEDGPRDSLESH